MSRLQWEKQQNKVLVKALRLQCSFPIGNVSCDTLKDFCCHHLKWGPFESTRSHWRFDKFKFLTHSFSWTWAGFLFFTITHSLLNWYRLDESTDEPRVVLHSAPTACRFKINRHFALAKLGGSLPYLQAKCLMPFSHSPLRGRFNR